MSASSAKASLGRREAAIERILDATVQLLSEFGYARFRSAAVAERSGMSEGSVFRYFQTKNDLVRAAFDRVLANRFAVSAERIKDDMVTGLTRRRLLETLWDLYSHPHYGWIYEIYASAYHDPTLRLVLEDVAVKYSTLIDDFAREIAVSTNLFPATEADRVAGLAIWSMQGLAVGNMLRPGTERNVGLIDFLLELADMRYGPEPQRA